MSIFCFIGGLMRNKLKLIKIIKYKGKKIIVNDELINTMLLILTSEEIKLLEEEIICVEV